MKTFYIRLNTIQDVRDFVNAVSTTDFDIDLTSGRYVVDAKSIMGIFSLDLLSPIKVTVHSDGDTGALEEKLSKFIVK
ncbi:MAG: HPr family phosphocarrier protein [Eubacteriales bacterium]|nr:HPr family phosphocarrier protein [Eubacteriales bacterium]